MSSINEGEEHEQVNKSPSKRVKRKDRVGKPIVRGGRKHKVTFQDQVLKKDLVTVHIVESYKKYNQIDNDDDVTTCNCSIL